MRFSIAQIGENRLKRVLIEDKQNNPIRLCEVLKSDFLNVSSCYVDEPQIDIEVKQSQDGVEFEIKLKCKRVKSFGVLA